MTAAAAATAAATIMTASVRIQMFNETREIDSFRQNPTVEFV